jgi:hypothetical protein
VLDATLGRVIRALGRSHCCRWGVPVVDRVDTAIFEHRYFERCLECAYCFDSCCQHGVDVDVHNVARLREQGPELERYTGVPAERWFTETWREDAEFPGGRFTRTRVEDGACVFRSRVPGGRGCRIHSYALEQGIDYHELKPMVSVLFPVTFDDGLLHCSTEIIERSLQCMDDGPTVYRGVRGEIAWYFGEALVSELDGLESLGAGAPGGGALAGTASPK